MIAGYLRFATWWEMLEQTQNGNYSKRPNSIVHIFMLFPGNLDVAPVLIVPRLAIGWNWIENPHQSIDEEKTWVKHGKSTDHFPPAQSPWVKPLGGWHQLSAASRFLSVGKARNAVQWERSNPSGKKKHGCPVDGFAILLSSTNSEDQKGKRTVL